jgi:hypothetical protein
MASPLLDAPFTFASHLKGSTRQRSEGSRRLAERTLSSSVQQPMRLLRVLSPMPRYYFNIVVGKGEPIPDLDGNELTGDQEALQHAEMVAQEMLGDRTRIAHRGTLLQPAWACGFAGNLKAFPILAGADALTILVDHDASGTGQDAAAECARRWITAGREVTRLTPRRPESDFADMEIAS